MPFDLIDRFSDDFDVSLDWLVKGTSPQNTSLSEDQLRARAFQIAVRMAFVVNGMTPEEVSRQMQMVKNLQRIIVAQVSAQVATNNVSLETAFELHEKTLESLPSIDMQRLADWPNLV